VRTLVSGLKNRAQEMGASSVQIGFMADGCLPPQLDEAGFRLTESNTYVWNAGKDKNFEEFLSRMVSDRRSDVRRERKRAQADGLRFSRLAGSEITADSAERFYPLYAENFNRHQGEPWLNEGYFKQIFCALNENLVLDVALCDGEWVAAVLAIRGGSCGQVLYWGQSGRAKHLHFEMVMYRSVEYALASAVNTLDIGAMGAHKAQRGLTCTPVIHGLWFRDPAFQDIVQAVCERRTMMACTERAAELRRLPFKILQSEKSETQ
jgi:predicted N-acyltransferase